MASSQNPQAPSGQRFVQANMVVRARHLSDQDRQRYNVPATAAPDTIGIFHPTSGELINTMGADQFNTFYHELDPAPGSGGAQSTAQSAQQPSGGPNVGTAGQTDQTAPGSAQQPAGGANAATAGQGAGQAGAPGQQGR